MEQELRKTNKDMDR